MKYILFLSNTISAFQLHFRLDNGRVINSSIARISKGKIWNGGAHPPYTPNGPCSEKYFCHILDQNDSWDHWLNW